MSLIVQKPNKLKFLLSSPHPKLQQSRCPLMVQLPLLYYQLLPHFQCPVLETASSTLSSSAFPVSSFAENSSTLSSSALPASSFGETSTLSSTALPETAVKEAPSTLSSFALSESSLKEASLTLSSFALAVSALGEVSSSTLSASASPVSMVPEAPSSSSASSAFLPTLDESVTKTASSGRLIKTDWFKQFDWLRYEQESRMFFCTKCVDACENNIFTKGKVAAQPKKDDFKKHEKSRSHLSAVKNLARQKEFKKATLKSYKGAEDSIRAQLVTLLTMAKECIASSKITSLIKMQIFNGAESLKRLVSDDSDLSSGTKHHYQHHTGVTEMYEALAHVVKEELKTELDATPYKFFSIEADEATDASNSSVVMVFLRYINKEGKTLSRFLGVSELEATRAEDVYHGILNVLNEHDLDTSMMVGLATDGASVMTGVNKGVATLFKKKNSRLIAVHCMAHRLQLACEKASHKILYITKYIGVLNQFAKSLKFSPKLKRALAASMSVHGEKGRKIVQIFFTWWLSFEKSVTSMVLDDNDLIELVRLSDLMLDNIVFRQIFCLMPCVLWHG